MTDRSSFPQQQKFSQADLGTALAQCAGYVAGQDWGSPETLFALVPTSVLASQAPDLVDADDESALSPVVQETAGGDLEELLTSISWPDAVVGCALVTEITVLPPGAESASGEAPDHPDRREARLIAGVLRTGQRLALLSLRATADDPDSESDLRTHPSIAPNVLDALASTF